MPAHPCKWPTCSAYVAHGAGKYCPDHASAAEAEPTRHGFYDQHARDKAAKAFYNSAAWKRARKLKLAADPVCQRCRIVFAQHVHHKKPLKQCAPAEKLDQANLKSLCAPCHNAEEAEARARENHVR